MTSSDEPGLPAERQDLEEEVFQVLPICEAEGGDGILIGVIPRGKDAEGDVLLNLLPDLPRGGDADAVGIEE